MSNKDYYQILGVARNATTKEIKEKYRDYIKHNHPDVVPENEKEAATQRMAEVNEAYQVLVDEEKRANYDNFGNTEFDTNMGGWGGFNFGDLFRHQPQQGIDGENILVSCPVTIDDLYNGAVKEVEYHRNVVCDECSGTGSKSHRTYYCDKCGGKGQIQETRQTQFGLFQTIHTCPVCSGTGKGTAPINDRCTKCNGTGIINTTEYVNVEIEKGSFSNIIVPNMGGKGHLGGRNGDLVVRLYVDNTGKYRIKDKNHPRNIYTTIDCKYSDLVLGNTFTLDTYCGKIDVVVPRGTTFDKPIIIKGKGLPYPNSTTYGDLIVELNLEVPKELDKKQEKIINKMKECGL